MPKPLTLVDWEDDHNLDVFAEVGGAVVWLSQPGRPSAEHDERISIPLEEIPNVVRTLETVHAAWEQQQGQREGVMVSTTRSGRSYHVVPCHLIDRRATIAFPLTRFRNLASGEIQVQIADAPRGWPRIVERLPCPHCVDLPDIRRRLGLEVSV